jgi:hypothetical protein
MKHKSLIVVAGIILVYLSVYLIGKKQNYSIRQNHNHKKEYLQLDSIVLPSKIDNAINNKLVLRIKKGYCSACIETLLMELNENIKLNLNNFAIITPFDNSRSVLLFKQYTRHMVINYPQSLIPLDTLTNYSSYFFQINEKGMLFYIEYYKGQQYKKFLNKMIK